MAAFLGTVARSVPQLWLLFILIVLPMNTLSGSGTPLESEPLRLQYVMQFSPSTHFVSWRRCTERRSWGKPEKRCAGRGTPRRRSPQRGIPEGKPPD